jgi:hypothetical protein
MECEKVKTPLNSLFQWLIQLGLFSVLLKLFIVMYPDFCSHTQRSPLVSSSHQHKGQKVSISGFTWWHGHHGLEKFGKWNSSSLTLPAKQLVVIVHVEIEKPGYCFSRHKMLYICFSVDCDYLGILRFKLSLFTRSGILLMR